MIDNVQVSGKNCSVVGCDKDIHAKTLCHNHYREQRRRILGIKKQEQRPKFCIVPNCTQKHYSLNYCSSHYYRVLNTGQVSAEKPIKKLIYGKLDCDVPFCKNKHKSGRLCSAHDTTRRTYNLTQDNLIKMLSVPCEVCGSEDSLTIDHDHSCCNSRSSCGKCVRGTLCQHCNRSMGQAKDNSLILRNLADYIDKHKDNPKIWF